MWNFRIAGLGLMGVASSSLASACVSPDAYPADLPTSTDATAEQVPTGGTGGVGPNATGGDGGIGTGSSTGTGNMGGVGGMGPACEPEGAFNGSKVEAESGQWTWVDVPTAKCRDGSGTGFGVRLSPASEELLIYFAGDTTCFNSVSCNEMQNEVSSYSEMKFEAWMADGGQRGIFDTSKGQNPLKDWNAVYIPYCTGDLHAGNAIDVDVPSAGPSGQSFVGYANVGLFLQRLVPTFADVTKVLVTGAGAGGFGATFNFHRIAQAFCPIPAILINDSGPIMDDKYLAPCLQERLRKLWGMSGTFPVECGDCTSENGGGMVNYLDYLSARYSGGRLAVISSMEDKRVRQFYGFGQSNCMFLDGLGLLSLPDWSYTNGLEDLRNNHMSSPGPWASYYLPENSHMHLEGNEYFSTKVQEVKLTDWVAKVINDGPMMNVGP